MPSKLFRRARVEPKRPLDSFFDSLRGRDIEFEKIAPPMSLASPVRIADNICESDPHLSEGLRISAANAQSAFGEACDLDERIVLLSSS